MNECIEHQKELSGVVELLGHEFKKKMEEKSGSLTKDLNDVTSDLPDTEGIDSELGIDFSVYWELRTMKLHLPEVTMKLQSWYFHLPSVTMKNKRIVFHTPSVRMVPKKIGQYPEFHGFKVVWKDIITHVPETFMQKQEIVMGIPEIKMMEQSVKLHIPEFVMKLQELKFHIPVITIKSISVESEKIKRRAEEITGSFSSVVETVKKVMLESAQTKITLSASKLFTCYRTSIQNSKEEAVSNFEPAINNLRQAIEKVRSVGANDQIPSLENQLNDLLNQKRLAEGKFEDAIEDMMLKEKLTVTGIMNSLSGPMN